MSQLANVTKADNPAPEKRIVWGEVYAPNRRDADGDYMTAETIEKMAYDFMREMKLDQIDTNHDNNLVEGCRVVESFIARKGDPDFIEGAWVIGLHVLDDDMWEGIKKGTYNGFSVEALVIKDKKEVDMEIPPVVTGSTSVHKSDDGDHSHKFFVTYDAEGNFLGGVTDVIDGHSHIIRAGTVTEITNDHRHRFSSVDNVLIKG